MASSHQRSNQGPVPRRRALSEISALTTVQKWRGAYPPRYSRDARTSFLLADLDLDPDQTLQVTTSVRPQPTRCDCDADRQPREASTSIDLGRLF